MDKIKRALSRVHGHSQDDEGAHGDHGNGQTGHQGPAEPHTQISKADLYRYGKQLGVNVGSWFCLERWLAPHLFEDYGAHGDSELDAVSAICRSKGPENARKILEGHWQEWVTETDFRWMKEHGHVNSIRVPVGYWHALEESEVKETDFSEWASCYKGALRILESKIELAEKYGIGVLVDLHGVPGGANGDAHSGTSSGHPKFFESGTGRFHRTNRNADLAVEAVSILATRFARQPNVVGIQVVNEPASGHSTQLEKYYERCLDETRGRLPLYISDSWDLEHWVRWTSDRSEFIVIDTHMYYCFAESDRQRSPEEIIKRVHETREQLAKAGDKASGSIVVGEWSCVMDGRTWSRILAAQRHQKAVEFGQAQSNAYTLLGSYFWTYKFRWGDGGEWGFRPMTEAHAIQYGTATPKPAENMRDSMLRVALDRSKCRETEQFRNGFEQGWDAARTFSKHGQLAYYGAWARKHSNNRTQRDGIIAGIKAYQSPDDFS